MTAKENVHSGHRERIVDKFVAHPDSPSDHELLEILLFSFIPRKNTNDIAHNLLNRFGSIEKVFACSPTELITVEGIGKKTAAGIALCGKIYEKIFERRNANPIVPWKNYNDYREGIKHDFEDLKDEKLIVYFLNEHFTLYYKLTFTDRVMASVKINLSELAEKIALKKPRYIIVAHNHPSGNKNPSFDDDITVKKLMLLCSTNGCALRDNLIVVKGDCYSYLIEKRFESNRELADLYETIRFLEGER